MAAGQKTHTEVPAKPKGHFPPFQPETFASQLFWFAIAFVVLYVIISRLAIPRIGGIMAARADRVSGDLAEARQLKDDSDAAIAAYEKALADARGRAQTIANETRQKHAADAAAARKALDDTLKAQIAQSERAITERRDAAMSNVQGIATEAAAAIVERLTGAAPTGADVARAVAGSLKR